MGIFIHSDISAESGIFHDSCLILFQQLNLSETNWDDGLGMKLQEVFACA